MSVASSLLLAYGTAWSSITRYQITPDRKHLARRTCQKPVHLSSVLVYLSRVEHSLQPTRLRGQLKQLLPLVLWQGGLFRQRTRGVLSFPLRLPLLDLSLFTGKGAGVVGEVVGFNVVRLDALKEVVAGLG